MMIILDKATHNSIWLLTIPYILYACLIFNITTSFSKKTQQVFLKIHFFKEQKQTVQEKQRL